MAQEGNKKSTGIFPFFQKQHHIMVLQVKYERSHLMIVQEHVFMLDRNIEYVSACRLMSMTNMVMSDCIFLFVFCMRVYIHVLCIRVCEKVGGAGEYRTHAHASRGWAVGVGRVRCSRTLGGDQGGKGPNSTPLKGAVELSSAPAPPRQQEMIHTEGQCTGVLPGPNYTEGHEAKLGLVGF